MSDDSLTKKRGWLNRNEMCASLGIALQSFDAWKVQPVAKIGRETFYTVADVVANRLAHQQAKFDRVRANESDEDTLDYQRVRLTREQADNMELKNEQARARLVPVDLLTLILSRVAGEWAGQADTIVPNLARRFPALETSVLEFIKLSIVKMQNSVARLDSVADDVIADYASNVDAG